MAAFRCRYCGRFFRPDPRKRGRSKQKTCGRERCRRANERRRWRQWMGRNPGYRASRRQKVRTWGKAYPNYWRHYRRKHPDYVRRDNLRRLAAKTRARRSAKQTVIARRVDALVDVLVWRERSAKQSLIAPVAGPVG